MREYVKPMMDSEVFVANEYFSACGDIQKVACLNMNQDQNIIGVYYDQNMDGIIDSPSDKFTTWNFMNDCNTNGSTIAGNHSISDAQKNNPDLRVIVKYGNGSEVPAIMDYNYRDGHTPHFISLKVANHS